MIYVHMFVAMLCTCQIRYVILKSILFLPSRFYFSCLFLVLDVQLKAPATASINLM